MHGDIVFDVVNPFTAKGFPIDELNRLALDRVQSISVMRAPTAVKALVIIFRVAFSEICSPVGGTGTDLSVNEELQ